MGPAQVVDRPCRGSPPASIGWGRRPSGGRTRELAWTERPTPPTGPGAWNQINQNLPDLPGPTRVPRRPAPRRRVVPGRQADASRRVLRRHGSAVSPTLVARSRPHRDPRRVSPARGWVSPARRLLVRRRRLQAWLRRIGSGRVPRSGAGRSRRRPTRRSRGDRGTARLRATRGRAMARLRATRSRAATRRPRVACARRRPPTAHLPPRSGIRRPPTTQPPRLVRRPPTVHRPSEPSRQRPQATSVRVPPTAAPARRAPRRLRPRPGPVPNPWARGSDRRGRERPPFELRPPRRTHRPRAPRPRTGGLTFREAAPMGRSRSGTRMLRWVARTGRAWSGSRMLRVAAMAFLRTPPGGRVVGQVLRRRRGGPGVRQDPTCGAGVRWPGRVRTGERGDRVARCRRPPLT